MSLHKKCLMKWFDNVTSIPTPSNVTWPQVRILTTSSSATVTKLCTYVGWERTIAEDRGCRGGYQAQLPIFMHFTLCQTRVSNEWPSYFMFKIQFTSIHESWILLKFLTPQYPIFIQLGCLMYFAGMTPTPLISPRCVLWHVDM